METEDTQGVQPGASVEEEGDQAMNVDSPPDSDDDDEDTLNENAVERKIEKLLETLMNNPYDYSANVQLIDCLRSCGELERLREARNAMSSRFPLTPSLWLSWIEDETNNLYERAVKDYVSFDVWMEYCQFAIGMGAQLARSVFERALTAVGLQANKGCLIWDMYREFEMAILRSKCADAAAIDGTNENSSEYLSQMNRLEKIFKRQLSLPLAGIRQAYEEYKQLFEESDTKTLDISYNAALKKLDTLLPLEDEIEQTPEPHLTAYQAYIEQEKKWDDPGRIQSVYERSLVPNCLNVDLWLEYLNYMEGLKIHDVILEIYPRAIRNCSWSAALWQRYLLALERGGSPWEKIEETFTRVNKEGGYVTANDGCDVWLTYAYALRRRVVGESETSKDIDYHPVTVVFQQGSEHLKGMFGEREWDVSCKYRKCWAYFVTKFCGNTGKMRRLWESILKDHGSGRYAALWLDYVQMEKEFGTLDNVRKLLVLAVNSVSDYPESVCEALIQFELEFGTLEQLDEAKKRTSAQLDRIKERTKEGSSSILSPRSAKSDWNQDKRSQKFEQKKHPKAFPKAKDFLKRKTPSSDEGPGRSPKSAKLQKDQDGFAIPAPMFSEPSNSKVKVEDEQNDSNSSINGATTTTPSDQQPKRDSSGAIDTSKYDVTAFVSNLNGNVTENDLKTFFESVGRIVSVRLTKRRGRVFGFVEFSCLTEKAEALKMDRKPLGGRPVFVSDCEDRSKSQKTAGLKFGTGVETHKLFVRNVDYLATEKQLSDFFNHYGKVKEARLVKHKNGNPKGVAYVEFETAQDASNALKLADNKKFLGRFLRVAISNPPMAKGQKFQGTSHGQKKFEDPQRRAKIDFVPRNIGTGGSNPVSDPVPNHQVPSAESLKVEKEAKVEDNPVDAVEQSKLSNEEFRKKFLKF